MNFSCPAEVEATGVVALCFSSHPVNMYSICPCSLLIFTLVPKHKKAMLCLLATHGINTLPSGMSSGAVGCKFNVNELTVCIK